MLNYSLKNVSVKNIRYFEPFCLLFKNRPSIGKASSVSQQPNIRQNDINFQTATDFFCRSSRKGQVLQLTTLLPVINRMTTYYMLRIICIIRTMQIERLHIYDYRYCRRVSA